MGQVELWKLSVTWGIERNVISRRRLILLFALSSVMTTGCEDPVEESQNLDVSGLWDFTEVLIRANQPVVCRDTGSIRLSSSDGIVIGSGGKIGTCTGFIGSFRDAGSFEVTQGILTDTDISFYLEDACGCIGASCDDAHYVGTIHPGPPMRISGRSACSVNYNGSWELVQASAVASLQLEPDSVGIVAGESIILLPETRTLAGTRVFERDVVWASSDSSTVSVDNRGNVLGRATGVGVITASIGILADTTKVSVRLVSLESVYAGLYHTCGIDIDGTAHCWGVNDFGQSGPEPSLAPCPGATCRRAPGAVPASREFSNLSLGFSHTCAKTHGGQVFCWGSNSGGQLGVDWSTPSSAVPVEISSGPVFQSIGAGTNHSCAVSDGGFAYCWGNNNRGQLGPGVLSSSATPVEVSDNLIFTSVAAGDLHSCGITVDRSAYCWGWNYDGQLGVDSVMASANPVRVYGNILFDSISLGRYHSCALTGGGIAYCWGSGRDGQLGNDPLDFEANPTPVSGGFSFVAISAGAFHTCGLTESGEAYCWGRGGDGRLGNGSDQDKSRPTRVAGGIAFSSISSGGQHTCGMSTEGIAYCWGSNFNGQVGNEAAVFLPQEVVGQR